MNHSIDKLSDSDYTTLRMPAASRIDDPASELIVRSRWIELAGLEQVPPGPAELQEEDLQAKVVTHLWSVKLSDGHSMHVVSSDDDLSSLEKSIHAWYSNAVMIMSVTRIGEVKGTATLNDGGITAKLLRLQVLEEEHTRLKRLPNERDRIIPSASRLGKDAEMIAGACIDGTATKVVDADPPKRPQTDITPSAIAAADDMQCNGAP